MARAMLMMEPDDPLDETEICDAYGEITNILIGGFKSRIAETVPEMKISIPSVVRGQKITPGAGSGIDRVDLDVNVDGSLMKLAVAYKKK
jgi:CheY-specific phosphatase CheX